MRPPGAARESAMRPAAGAADAQESGAGGRTLVVNDLDGPLAEALLQGTRLRVIALLSSDAARERGGYSIQELGDLLGCSPQNAHHHLRILQEAGAARVVRSEGTQRVPRQYWLSDVRALALRHEGLAPVDIALGRSAGPATPLDARLSRMAEDLALPGLRALAESRLGTALAGLSPAEAAALRDALLDVGAGGPPPRPGP